MKSGQIHICVDVFADSEMPGIIPIEIIIDMLCCL